MKQWDIYYTCDDGFSDYMPCDSKAEAIREAKKLAKDDDIVFVEVKAYDGVALIEESEIEIYRKEVKVNGKINF